MQRQFADFGAACTDMVFEQMEVNGLVKKLEPLLTETFPKTIDVSTELETELPPVLAETSCPWQRCRLLRFPLIAQPRRKVLNLPVSAPPAAAAARDCAARTISHASCGATSEEVSKAYASASCGEEPSHSAGAKADFVSDRRIRSS